MNRNFNLFSRGTNRRSFLKNGTAAAGAATVRASLLGKGLPALAEEDGLTRGNAAILRFLQALETIEADLWKQYDELQTNLIMPEPTIFLNKEFGPVSIIRPTESERAAMNAVKGLMADGLFIGQTLQFFEVL